jgi:DmsE family decaheme c-type cytochrome
MKLFSCALWLAFLAAAFSTPSWGVEQKGNGYAGTDTCLGCHEKQAAFLKKSPHWKKAVASSPINGQGCESCHGPGAAHAEAGGGRGVGGIMNFGKGEPAQKKMAACLSCHNNGPKLALWDSGIHKTKDVSCSDCHSVHGRSVVTLGFGHSKDPLGYAPRYQYDVCSKCHLDVKAQVNRRSHHPIIEGRVTCSSCHQPHGSLYPNLITAASVNQLCYKCHAEKRGPFMWEHQPVDENCAICHTPHGSPHLRLLSEKVPNLCQACHDSTRHPGTRYSKETLFTGAAPSNRSFARSCLNCHANIHGTNAPGNPSNGLNSGAFFVR